MSWLRVVLVGAGSLGSEVAWQLLQHDVTLRSVLVVDPDCLESRNVPLSHLFLQLAGGNREAVLGRAKAELLVAEAESQGQSDWRFLQAEIADVGWQELAAADLWICCTDSALARVELAILAHSLQKPVLDGGVFGTQHAEGRVTWFSGDLEAACYLCGLREQRRAEMLAYALAPALGCRVMDISPSMGPYPLVPGHVVAVARRMVSTLKTFAEERGARHGKRSEAWAERVMCGKDNPAKRIMLQRSPTCPLHEEEDDELVVLEGNKRLADALADPCWRLQLPWPVCLRARCQYCGALDTEPQRLARLRRRGVCRICGTAGKLDPLRCVRTLGIEDEVAQRLPQTLGLPERHMLLVRRSVLLSARHGTVTPDGGR